MMRNHFWATLGLPAGAAACLLVLLGAMLAGVASPAAAREPMKVDGKETIYQRVLSRPGATVSTGPGAEETVDAPTPFSAFYVFARREADGAEWLEVGPTAGAEPVGWMRSDESVAWRQTLVLTFANPAGRLKVLFFEDEQSLYDVVEDERLPAIAPDLEAQARAGIPPEGSGIVSVEPEAWPDFGSRFYLLPILQAQEAFLATGQRAKIVEIASIPLAAEPAEPPPEEEDFMVGVMFVIDTTTSMQPYIDRTRDVVRRIHERIRGSEIGDRVSFGLVAFRDATDGVPGLDYVTRVVSPLRLPPDHPDFLRRISEVEASPVSSRGFREDGLAGVLAALERDEWKDFGGRYVIFISDAGVREGEDPRNSTGQTVETINAVARDKVIAIFSLLLATPIGTAYHEEAARQFERLSYWEGVDTPTFHTVPEGNLDEFEPTVDLLTDRLIEQVGAMGVPAEVPAETAAPAAGDACGSGATGSEGLLASADCIGHAMRMAWLGRTRGTDAPSVFRAWAPDFALDQPTRRAFEVRLLLTKTQLSRMAAAMQAVLQVGERAIDEDPATFFDQLRTVIARASVDPAAIEGIDPASLPAPDELDNLGDLLGEYLDDLPYTSQLAGMSEDVWLRSPPTEQDRLISRIRSKLRAYQHFHDDADRWIKLHPDASDGERVYPIPIELLP